MIYKQEIGSCGGNGLSNIVITKGLKDENAKLLCEWTNENRQDFLEQWAGPALKFPLTIGELSTLENYYSIFYLEEFVGGIQRVRIEDNNVHIGRFIINPRKTGKGMGKQALIEFVNLIFEDKFIDSVSLTVFDHNKNAKGLYTKLGFEITETIEEPKKKYIMKKFRNE